MKSKILKYGLWTVISILVIALLGFQVFVSTFEIFEPSEKKVLVHKCDGKGLRQAEIYSRAGNAVTTPSIHVSVQLGCGNSEPQNEKVIFTVDNFALADDDVKINWLTFDTLAIEYKKGLRIFTQLDNVAYRDSTLNLHVTYREF